MQEYYNETLRENRRNPNSNYSKDIVQTTNNTIRATEQTPLGRDMVLNKVRKAFVMLVVKTIVVRVVNPVL